MKTFVHIGALVLLAWLLSWGTVSCSRDRLDREALPASAPASVPEGEGEASEDLPVSHGPHYIPLEQIDTLLVRCNGDNAEEEAGETDNEGEEDGTKTYLGENYSIYWNAGDRVKVYYAPLDKDNYTVSTVENGDVKESAFDAVVDKGASYYFASYPEGVEATLMEVDNGDAQNRTYGKFEVVIPAEQDGRFEHSHIAVGKASATDCHFAFKNVASYLQVIVSNTTATALTLQASNPDDNLVGTLVVPFTDAEGSLGALTLKEGTGSSSVTVTLDEHREVPCTLYVALLPDVFFSKGFRMRYEYADGSDTPGFAYAKRSGRTIARRRVLEVGTLDNYIRSHWFVKTDGQYDNPNEWVAGSSWNKALTPAGLAALLAQPSGSGSTPDVDAVIDRAWMLDGATIHLAAGTYNLSDIDLEYAGYDHPVRLTVWGGHHPSLGGTYVGDVRDTIGKRTVLTGNGHRCLTLGSQTDLSMDKVWFADCVSSTANAHGAALRVQGGTGTANLTLTDCTFKGNIAQADNCNGGAFAVSQGTATLTGCLFISNTTGNGQLGGAVFLNGGSTLFSRCSFLGNHSGTGGAFYCQDSDLNLRDVILDHNTATTGGAAFYADGNITITGTDTLKCAIRNHSNTELSPFMYGASSRLDFTGCKFSGNSIASPSSHGGLFPMSGQTFRATRCVFDGNTISNTSGNRNGVLASLLAGGNGTITLSDSKIRDCRGAQQAGAIYLSGGLGVGGGTALQVTGCRFTGNQAEGYGGVVNFDTTNPNSIAATFTDCVFIGNTAGSAGGVMHLNANGLNRRVTCTDCTFERNKQTYTLNGFGGGVFNLAGGYLSLYGCNAERNESLQSNPENSGDYRGGGFLYSGGDAEQHLVMQGSTKNARPLFRYNKAAWLGGVLSLTNTHASSTFTIEEDRFFNNTCVKGGGAIYWKTSTAAQPSLFNTAFKENTVTGDGWGDAFCSPNCMALTLDGNNKEKNYITNHTSTCPIYTPAATRFVFTRLKFSDNSTTLNGSLIRIGTESQVAEGTFTLTKCEMQNNVAPHGGVIWVNLTSNSGVSTLVECTLAGNTASDEEGLGGAVYWNCDSWSNNDSQPSLRFRQCSLTGNRTGKAGSAVYLEKGYLIFESSSSDSMDSFISDNTFHRFDHRTDQSAGCGGAIMMHTSACKIDLTNTTLSGNVSDGFGGAIYLNGGRLFMTKCICRDNEAYFRGGAICQTGSDSFFLMKKCYLSGNRVSGNYSWGDAIHSNVGKSMMVNSTLEDGDTPHAASLVNGSINLMMVGCTLVGNNSKPTLRVEGNRSGLLLNNIILNRATEAASVWGSGVYSWSTYCAYNVLGSLGNDASGTPYTPRTGDVTGKSEADLGAWTRKEDGFYTWNGYIGTQAALTPDIDASGHTDPVSTGMKNGFPLGFSISDGKKLDYTTENLGRSCLTGWCSADYYSDQRGLADRRTGSTNLPGSYAPLVRQWIDDRPGVACSADSGAAMRNEEIVVTASNISASTTVTVRFGNDKTLTRTGPGSLSYAFATAGSRTIAVTTSPAEVAQTQWTVKVEALDALSYLSNRLQTDPELCLVMCHRANSSDWTIPENSLSALNKCIADQIDIVEIDLQTSKDGQLVVAHDATLDRATTGSGSIGDYTLAQLKTLRLKDRNGNVTSEQMISFEECLDACKGKIYINLDIAKRNVDISTIIGAVRERGMLEQVLLYCSTTAQLQKAFEWEPRVNVMAWYSDNNLFSSYGLPGKHYWAQCEYYPNSSQTSASGVPSTRGAGTAPEKVEAVAETGSIIVTNAIYTLDEVAFYPNDLTVAQVTELFARFPNTQCLHVDVGAETRLALQSIGKHLVH